MPHPMPRPLDSASNVPLCLLVQTCCWCSCQSSFAIELRLPRNAAIGFTCNFGLAVHSTLEFADDARKMTMHCGASSLCIARGNRGQYRRVIMDGAARERLSVKMLLHPAPEFRSLVPQSLDDQFQRTVTGGFGDTEMKVPVRFLPNHEVVHVRRHARYRFANRIKVFAFRVDGSKCRHFAFDQSASTQEFKWPGTFVSR